MAIWSNSLSFFRNTMTILRSVLAALLVGNYVQVYIFIKIERTYKQKMFIKLIERQSYTI